MKRLYILPLFLLLATCLSAQEPHKASQDRTTVVENIAYLIDAYAEQKYGRLCESDEKLDSVFYELAKAAYSIPSDEFKKRADSTFNQRMKSLPLLKADGWYSRATPSMFMYTYLEIYRNYLLLKQPCFRLDTMSTSRGLDYVYYMKHSKLMELARAYAAIKYFYPYISCTSSSLASALKETVQFYLASAFEREEYQVAFSGYYGFEYEWFLFRMTFDVDEQDLVGYFIFKTGHANIMQAFPVRERIDEFESLFELRNSDESSLLSTKRYKLPARLSYDDSSFRVSFSDESGASWPLDKIGSLNLNPLHRLIMSSCSADKAAMLGNICHRLSYSAFSGTIFTFRKQGETLQRELKNVPISREVEKMVLLRKKNRETPLQAGRNMFLRWLPDESEVLDSIIQVVYSSSPDTLFIETRSQYGSLQGVASCLASRNDTFMLKFWKHCAHVKDPIFRQGPIATGLRLDSEARSKLGERKFVVCVLVDSTTTGENEMYAMLLQSQPRCCVKGTRTNGAYGTRVYYNYGYPNKYLVFPSDGIMYPDGRKLVPGGLRIDVPDR